MRFIVFPFEREKAAGRRLRTPRRGKSVRLPGGTRRVASGKRQLVRTLRYHFRTFLPHGDNMSRNGVKSRTKRTKHGQCGHKRAIKRTRRTNKSRKWDKTRTTWAKKRPEADKIRTNKGQNGQKEPKIAAQSGLLENAPVFVNGSGNE